MLPNFSTVSTNITTVYRGVSSCLWYGRCVPAAAEGLQPLTLSSTEMILVWRPCSFVCYFVSVSCTVALSATPYRGMNLVWRVCRKYLFLLFLWVWSLIAHI